MSVEKELSSSAVTSQSKDKATSPPLVAGFGDDGSFEGGGLDGDDGLGEKAFVIV